VSFLVRVLAAIAIATTVTGGTLASNAAGRSFAAKQLKVPLSEPQGLTLDTRGNIWVADTGHNRVMEISAAGKPMLSIGKHGKGPGQMDAPEGLAIDGSGNLYVGDFNNRRLQKLSPNGKQLAQWNNSDPQFGCQCKDAAIHGHAVYVVDSGSVDLYRLSTALKVTKTLDTGNSSVEGVAVDVKGNLWVVTDGPRVEELSPVGKILTRWGKKGKQTGQFDTPEAIALDHSGNVYIADAGNNRVQKFSARGKTLAVYGQSGSALAMSSNPEGVAVDTHGNVFVADTYNDRIQVFSPSGVLLQVWAAS
jgi:sugar lactone lactonase YvrE